MIGRENGVIGYSLDETKNMLAKLSGKIKVGKQKSKASRILWSTKISIVRSAPSASACSSEA